MSEKKYLQEMREELGGVIEQNIIPALENMESRINSRFDLLVSQMVNKEYLDDKLADLEGVIIVRQRKEDKKLNLLIDILKEKKVIKDTDINRLKEIKVFPDPNELL